MQQSSKKPLIIITSIIVTIIFVIVCLLIGGFFRQNPYGTGIKITNFNHYFKNVSTNTRDATFAALYTTASYNISTPPTTGAIIRDGSITNNYNDSSLSTLSTFLVDIESIQQTYQIQMSWSNDPDASIAGYSILVTCPTSNQLIYPAFECQDMLTQDPLNNLYNKFPILNQLPLTESYFIDNGANLVHYTITYRTDQELNNITLIITDYTGNSHDRALQKLREYNVLPSQYVIEYNNESNFSESPAKAPND